MLGFIYKFGIDRVISKRVLKAVILAALNQVFAHNDRLISAVSRHIDDVADRALQQLMEEVKKA